MNRNVMTCILGLVLSCMSTSPLAETNGMVVRPSLHFTPPSHWMNDPNGMVYFDGEYHLFYQHYPAGLEWGPMHWGHAISTNLVEWQHLPIALYPDEKGMIFSGSAVMDAANTSGLGTTERPPMVALFTYHDEEAKRAGSQTFQSQGLAYSLDHGRTWVKHKANPVVPNPGLLDFRDPKVSWYQPTQRWVMVVTQGDTIGFYSSKNLLDWQHESDFGEGLGAHGGVWECPDLVRIGDHYVLIVSLMPGGPNGGSATQYFVGDFDGQRFLPAEQHLKDPTKPLWLDWGMDNYAGVTFSGTESLHDLPILIGWASNWLYANHVPATTWRSTMTLPRELFLYSDKDRVMLGSRPMPAVDVALPSIISSGSIAKLPHHRASKLTLALGAGQGGELKLKNTLGEHITVTFDPDTSSIRFDRTHSGQVSFSDSFGATATAPYDLVATETQVDLYYDGNVIELFVDAGKTSMTMQVFPSEPYSEVMMSGALTLKELRSQ